MGNRSRGGRSERGFALVIAILSLMLLTFLGLTLAATTSTELQIATNYRWDMQALYNAEAGIEVARVELANLGAGQAGDPDPLKREWGLALPRDRAVSWYVDNDPATAAPPPPVEAPGTGRDFAMRDCDVRSGMGYGRVLDTGTRFENVSTWGGQGLNGAFTLWVRRGVLVADGGAFRDDPRNDMGIIVSEGIAPFTSGASSFAKAHQAVRVLETRFALGVTRTSCVQTAGQEGVSATGTNYNPCAPLFAESAAASLEGAFGGAGAGSLGALTDTGRVE
jgi:hypothetical protein